jgi:hypothetical protein
MRGIERWFVLWSLGYMVLYIPVFLIVAVRSIGTHGDAILYLLPFHFVGMIQNIVALVLTIRDLYLRPFPHENQKLTWLLLILLTCPIGWLVYIFRYALKPRENPTLHATAHP